MSNAVMWIVASIPSALCAAGALYGLVTGGSLWWLLGFGLAWLLVPSAE